VVQSTDLANTFLPIAHLDPITFNSSPFNDVQSTLPKILLTGTKSHFSFNLFFSDDVKILQSTDLANTVSPAGD